MLPGSSELAGHAARRTGSGRLEAFRIGPLAPGELSAKRRASRLMSTPTALARWKRCAPSGFSIGIMVTVSRSRIATRSGPPPASAKKRMMSANAIVAVDSSPCICDQSSTRVGPVPKVTARMARP